MQTVAAQTLTICFAIWEYQGAYSSTRAYASPRSFRDVSPLGCTHSYEYTYVYTVENVRTRVLQSTL